MLSKCRNCLSTASLSRHLNDDNILRCSACGAFQYTGPLESVAGLYTEKYFKGAEYVNYELAAPVFRRNFISKLDLIRKQAPDLPVSEMRVLEIGSATGDFMEVLQKAGVGAVLGVEASEFARQRSVERGFSVLDPFAKDYLEQVRAFRPNVICAWDVWEHIEHPGDVFAALLEQNPSIVVVAISTVDSGALVPRLNGKKWRQFHPPTHLNYPTKKSFAVFFHSLGFEVSVNKPVGYYRPLADYLSVFLPSEWLNSMPKLFKVPLYLNLFDIQLVIATKRQEQLRKAV